MKYWEKSINATTPLGAYPELARTYAEIGKRLLEKNSRFQELNGLSAEEYLEKAQALFTKMDLPWELEELNKIDRPRK